mmetsp:Transcript_44080/g.103121  ORF Transcript_44080/g.103121 Transcript_44080/m.103121 type:complete len:669 (+) Transcript_44080:804-2810(+)
MRVNQPRHRLLPLPQVVRLAVKLGLPLLRVELGGVAVLLQLHEEVAQVLLEGCLVLAALKHAVDRGGHLRRDEVGEGGGEHLHQQLAHILRVGSALRRAVLRPQGAGDGGRLDGEEEVREDHRLQLEARLVQRVGEHREDVLQQTDVVRLVESVHHLRGLHVLQQLEQRVQPRLGDVALRVLERPLDRLDHQCEVALLGEQRGEAVVVDGPEQRKEVEPVLEEVLEVLGDHVERALEDRLEDARHLRRHQPLQLVDERAEEDEHLGVTGGGDGADVVAEDRVEQRGHELVEHELVVLGALDVCDEQLEGLLLHRSHRAHARGVHHHRGVGRGGDGGADPLRVRLVHVEQRQVDLPQLHGVRVAEGCGDALVGADDVLQLLHDGRLDQRLAVGLLGLREDLLPHLVGPLHQLDQQPVARLDIGLRRDHVPERLVEDVHLRRLEVEDRLPQVEAQLIDEGHRLAHLQHHELAPALLRDLQEGVDRHVLHARMQLVHELEELVDHRLEELPVRAQKARVLAHYVHDVGGDDRFVVLASLHLAQPQQVLDHGDEESLLVLLRHGARDGAHRPAELVQIVPRPLRAVHLVLQLLEHDVLRVVVVEVRQVDQRLAHRLVHDDGVRVLHRLPHDVAVLILHDEHLLRLRHARHHQHPQLAQHRRIELQPRRSNRR